MYSFRVQQQDFHASHTDNHFVDIFLNNSNTIRNQSIKSYSFTPVSLSQHPSLTIVVLLKKKKKKKKKKSVFRRRRETMRQLNLLDLASTLLFAAFFLSLTYELWRDYVRRHCSTQPTPLLRISDNRVNDNARKCAPAYVDFLCNVVPGAHARRVAHAARRRVHVHHALLSKSSICTMSLCLRLALSPLAASSIASNSTLHSALLGAVAVGLRRSLSIKSNSFTTTLPIRNDNRQVNNNNHNKNKACESDLVFSN
jgi:hypothetical protein